MMREDGIRCGDEAYVQESSMYRENRKQKKKPEEPVRNTAAAEDEEFSCISEARDHDGLAGGAAHTPATNKEGPWSTRHGDGGGKKGNPGRGSKKIRVSYATKNTGMATERPSTGETGIVQRLFSSISYTAALNVYLTVTGIHLFFLILATALSQLDEVGGGCFTFWGYKKDCDTVSYTYRTQLLNCTKTKERLQTGAAFSIFAILLMSAQFLLVFHVFMVYKHERRQKYHAGSSSHYGEHHHETQGGKVIPAISKWHIFLVSVLALLCEMICWSMTISIYLSRFCEVPNASRTTTYGVGFGFLLTGWIGQIVVLIPFACKSWTEDSSTV